MNSATRVNFDLVSSTQGLFFVFAFTRNDLDGGLATDVLVVVLTGKILGPVPTSHWVYGGLDEDGGRVWLVIDVEGHSPLLQRSEVTTLCSMKMRMDAFLFLFLPPW